MASSFLRRRIRVTFQLATGSFNKDGEPDTVVLEDFRCRVEISAQGGYDFAHCNARIYGIEKETMDRLTVINFTSFDFMRNVVTIEATDNEGQFVKIFTGDIYQSSPDYNAAPDVPFIVEARSGLIGSLAKSNARSFPGACKVKDIMKVLAAELNLELENNGVESTLTDQYLGGTALQKVQRVAVNANIQYWYLPEEGVLAIAPMGYPREKYPAIKVNASTGLVKWPVKRHVGIEFTALFSPQILHGGKILMESSVPNCNGEWYIVSMNHHLDSEMPGGAWFTDFVATPYNVFVLTR